jgi:hypothetical protein
MRIQGRTLEAALAKLPNDVDFVAGNQLDHGESYALEVPIEQLQRSLPRLDNCTVSWTIHERNGPWGDRSVRTEIVDGRPETVAVDHWSLHSDVELTLSFVDILAVRSGQKDGLEVLQDAKPAGDLVDLMCAAGVMNSDAWLEVAWLPQEIASDMAQWATFARSGRLFEITACLLALETPRKRSLSPFSHE